MSVVPIEYYTYDDYKEWEGNWELIKGTPYAMSLAPIKNHQRLSGKIFSELNNSLECKNCEVLYEIDYKINEDTILRPDIVLTCDDDGVDYLIKAPEIIVEIISPSTARRDEIYKFKIYENEKVNFLVLVYPNDLFAKIYKNVNGKFTKIGDFSKGTFDFEFCHAKIDFDNVFNKNKK